MWLQKKAKALPLLIFSTQAAGKSSGRGFPYFTGLAGVSFGGNMV